MNKQGANEFERRGSFVATSNVLFTTRSLKAWIGVEENFRDFPSRDSDYQQTFSDLPYISRTSVYSAQVRPFPRRFGSKLKFEEIESKRSCIEQLAFCYRLAFSKKICREIPFPNEWNLNREITFLLETSSPPPPCTGKRRSLGKNGNFATDRESSPGGC